MLYIPKNTKYRKIQKGRIQSIDPKANNLVQGRCGLIAVESAYVKASQTNNYSSFTTYRTGMDSRFS